MARGSAKKEKRCWDRKSRETYWTKDALQNNLSNYMWLYGVISFAMKFLCFEVQQLHFRICDFDALSVLIGVNRCLDGQPLLGLRCPNQVNDRLNAYKGPSTPVLTYV